MSDLGRPVPPPAPARGDWYAPSIIAASLFVHAAAIGTFVWSHRAEAARPPAEIPVEVVQLPPEPPKPEPKKPEPPKPQPQAAKPPEPKPPEPKPPEPKPQQPKPQQPKQAAQKPPAPKPPAQTQAAKPPAPRPPEPKQARKPPPPQDAQKDVAERMQQLLGPMPAMAMPAMAANNDDPLDDGAPYQRLVLSRVAKQKREGRHEGIPGHVVVAFEIGDGGEVLSCDIREKSGDPALDAEAIAMVHRAAPYPPPPPGAMRKFSFGLRFQVM